MPLTPERAKEVWLNRGIYNTDVSQLLTPDECKSVDDLWATMPDNTSWMSAFFQIMNYSPDCQQSESPEGFIPDFPPDKDFDEILEENK